RTANRPAELLATKILERLAIRCVRCQALDALVVEQRSLHQVRAGLRNDIDDAARGVAELCAGAGRNDLKLLHSLERDVDRRALPAHLLAEEAVGVVATVEADVVEDAALARKR